VYKAASSIRKNNVLMLSYTWIVNLLCGIWIAAECRFPECRGCIVDKLQSFGHSRSLLRSEFMFHCPF